MFFKKFFIFLVANALFSTFIYAELILLKTKNNQLIPVNFAKANEEEKAELSFIYKEILNKYQFPMISMYYDLESDENKNIIDNFLNQTSNSYPEQELANYFINQKYGDKYKAIYIPNTLFEASAIITILKDLNHTHNDIKNFSTEVTSFLSQQFFESFNQIVENKETILPEILLAEFLKSSYSPYNISGPTEEIYFKVVEKLLNFNGVENLVSGDFASALKDTFARFTSLMPKLREKVILNAKSLDVLKHFNYNIDEFLNTIFRGEEGQDLLVKYQNFEIEAAKDGKFLLARGTGGLNINDEQFLLDLPYRELRTDYQNLVLKNPNLPKLIEKKYGLSKPISLKISENKDYFTLSSFSYGTTLLAGTMNECSIKDVGARAFDYFVGKKAFGYIIPIGILEYLKEKNIKELFFVSPFNRVVGLLAKGEFFHSRSKVSFFQKGKTWNSFNNGIFGFQSYNTDERKEIFLADFTLKVGAFTASQKDWPALAGKITKLIGQRAIILLNESGKDESDIKKNQVAVGNFLLELNNLEKVYPDMQIYNESQAIKNKVNDFLLSNIKDSRIYNIQNPFYKIILDPLDSPFRKTELIINNEDALVINDLKPRTKDHMLAIPKGDFISLSHFADHANKEQIDALFKIIAEAAKAKGLDKTGYRIISNHGINPRIPDELSENDNQANQEIPHLHIHIAGGECLGKPVALKSWYMGIDETFLPFGFALDEDRFLDFIRSNELFSQALGDEGQLIVYKIPENFSENIPVYLGLTILNANKKPMYFSIDDFSKTAPLEHKEVLIKTLSLMASIFGIDKTGYRIFSNHGANAWQEPKNIFQIFLVGGAPLGITVTNIYGNKINKEGSELDYKDLGNDPHFNCPNDPSLSIDLASSIQKRFRKNQEILGNINKIKTEIENLLTKNRNHFLPYWNFEIELPGKDFEIKLKKYDVISRSLEEMKEKVNKLNVSEFFQDFATESVTESLLDELNKISESLEK